MAAMTIEDMYKRIREINLTNSSLKPDYEELLEEREGLCMVLHAHQRACRNARCRCKQPFSGGSA
jgi:hypothetical protein